MTDIEKKEIRGITFKLATAIMTSTVIIVATFVGGISHFENKVNNNTDKITTLSGRVDKVENRQDRIEGMVYKGKIIVTK